MSAAAAAVDPSGETAFTRTFAAFCSELVGTFPELAEGVRRVAGRATPTFFWKSWQDDLAILAERDFAALQARRRGILFVPVVMTPALWSEISEKSQGAIWRYLRALILEAVMELHLDATALTEERLGVLMQILIEERGGEDEEAVSETVMEEAMERLAPLMDRLKGMMGAAGGLFDASGLKGMFDASGLAGMFAGGVSGEMPSLPEIPERLRKGRIAQLAEQMAKQFDPADFGIDPALLRGDNVVEVLKGLAEMYQRDPTKLIGGAKRVAEKIKRQIMGGSLDREALIAEAKEFVELFRNHPTFKEAIAKFEGLVGEGGLAEMFGGAAGGGGGASSDRLRAVQERLRKKLAAREAAAKKSGGSGSGAR
jgi:hypothetical protein